MYLRFVVHSLDDQTGKRLGLFSAAHDLLDTEDPYAHDRERLAQLLAWFDANLDEPHTFHRSRKYSAADVALSWFKSTAHEHVAKMYEMAAVLSEYGVTVQVIKTQRPGYIVYEDAWQAVAEPFAETRL